jgi:hypothetical protein
MLTITGIYATEDIVSKEKIIRFTGKISSKKLLDLSRIEHPDDFFKDIGRLVIQQFNNEKNWI